MAGIKFDLTYDGEEASNHLLDLYDASIALVGFQRSLAITTHLVLNGEVITQAPSLRGAQILSEPPEEGSWKITAVVVAGIFSLGTASRDTPIGHMVASAYDYVVSEALGFHVDFEKTLGQQYEDRQKNRANDLPILTKPRFESAIEKCEVAIRDMHRPIVFSETATEARLSATTELGFIPVALPLTRQSFEHMRFVVERDNPQIFHGRVSSYNVNTYKGRVFLGDAERPIAFELADLARNPTVVAAITQSLDVNARNRRSPTGVVEFEGIAMEGRTGRLRSILILGLGERAGRA